MPRPDYCPARPRVHVLMGGDVAQDWDARPEDEAVLIGTQDQFLSRALNRGYAMSRFRWPLDFALLHNDAFWIFDEVQLMGAGLPTSTQLEAFRRRFACAVPCRSLWCSATLHPQWLASVDFAAQCPAPRLAALQEDDTAFPQVRQRIHASKQVLPLAGADNSKQLADAVLAAHRPGTLTLVIRNRVRDAVELFEILRKRKDTPPLCLLHSRFRPADRAAVLQAALAAPDAGRPHRRHNAGRGSGRGYFRRHALYGCGAVGVAGAALRALQPGRGTQGCPHLLAGQTH